MVAEFGDALEKSHSKASINLADKYVESDNSIEKLKIFAKLLFLKGFVPSNNTEIALSVLGGSAGKAAGKIVGKTVKLNKKTVDKLLNAGQKIDKNGLTKAGRALQKHGDRTGSVFPKSSGNAAARNKQGQDVLEKILKSDNKSVVNHKSGVKDIIDNRTGKGVRYNSDGSFKGFLEPTI